MTVLQFLNLNINQEINVVIIVLVQLLILKMILLVSVVKLVDIIHQLIIDIVCHNVRDNIDFM